MRQYILSGLALLLLLSLHSIPSHGWGQTGHRVIGEIAQKHLSKKAKKNIQKLMGHESLAKASTWMDEVKSDDAYDHTHSWHYVTIPDSLTYARIEKEAKGDVIWAIGRMKDIIKSDTASLESKRIALRFLVHLVGDMHQPLHVGGGDDRGGNNVKVKWFYKPSNLHRVWDSEMIDGKQLSYTELVRSIDHASLQQIKQWQNDDIMVWTHEAMELRPQVYDTGDKDKMGYEYAYKNWGTVEQQLLKAGIRLAGELNELFG